MPRLAGRVTPFAFRFALVVLTFTLYGIVAFAVAGSRPAVGLLAGVAVVMAVNAVVPHLTLTVAFRCYAPGTGTAIGFLLPLSLLVIIDGLAAGALTGRNLLATAVMVAVTLLVAVPPLFLIGRFVDRRFSRVSTGGVA